jgi:plasmid stabilization system protein ParE
MAEIVWSEPAPSDLDAIADYIALENPVVASEPVKRVFGHVDQLADHPESGAGRKNSAGRGIARLWSRLAASSIGMTDTRSFPACDAH